LVSNSIYKEPKILASGFDGLHGSLEERGRNQKLKKLKKLKRRLKIMVC
jgi:superfamily II DNA/RNA helicase